MRILRVIVSLNPAHGGPVEGLKQSSGQLAARGHQTEVVTLDAPDASYLANLPFPVHAKGPGITRYRFTSKIGRWIADNRDRFDVVVVHGLWNHASIGGGLAVGRAKLPYVVFTHGMMDPWFRDAYPLKHMAKQAFWLGGQGRVLQHAQHVLFTSEDEMRLASGQFWGPTYSGRLVTYGASDVPDAPEEQRAAFQSSVPSLGDAPYILFLSRIHPKKGCDMLVEAFARLAPEVPDLHLVIAGPDQVGEQATLEAAAGKGGVSDRVHFAGMLQGPAKWGAFRGAEAFILPSHQENFGIVVAEAMACGTPALISNKVNIWREVEETGAGLVEPDTVEGTYALMRNYLALSPPERAAMRQRARAGYEQKFGLEAAATDLEAVLLEIGNKKQ